MAIFVLHSSGLHKTWDSKSVGLTKIISVWETPDSQAWRTAVFEWSC